MQQWDFYCVPNAYEDSFSLVHVVDSDGPPGFEEHVAVVELEWRSAGLPTLDEIMRHRPPHVGAGERVATWIDGLQPRSWIRVGNSKRKYRLPLGVSNSYGGFERYGRVPAAQSKRLRSKTAKAPKGPGSRIVFSYWRSRLKPSGDWAWATAVADETVIDWRQALDVPNARIRMCGPDPYLHEMFQGNQQVMELHWLEHGRDTLDFSSNDLYEVEVSFGNGLQRLALPAEVRNLRLVRDGDGSPPIVEHVQNGRGLDLTMAGPAAFVATEGLERIRSLTLETNRSDLDLTPAIHFPDVERARLRLDGGGCHTLDQLAHWTRLQILTVIDMYDFDPEQLPPVESWNQLDMVEFHGLPRSAATVLRKRLKNAYQFRVGGARGDKWLAENARNPFRHWVDLDETAGKKAAKAYVKARAALQSGEVERAIRSLIADLNKIAEELPIESTERDESWTAIEALGLEHGTSSEQAAEWFDEDRVF